MVSGVGQWYKSGEGLVAVRWVFVHDVTGTHRDGYFMTTDVGMTATAVIETYTSRWNLETTFQEMRSGLGLETTRGWKERTVLRVAACLFGMYTLVAALYSRLPRRYVGRWAVSWPGKRDVTFGDAQTAVVVGGMGFCNPWLQGGLCKTIPAVSLAAVARPCSSYVSHG